MTKKAILNTEKLCSYEALYGTAPVTVVPIPEGGESGDMDPRVYAQSRAMPLVTKLMSLRKGLVDETKLIGTLRREFGRYKGSYIADDGIVTTFADAESYDGRAVPLRVYRAAAFGEGRPVTVYFHGGGFFGGSPAIVEELCKLLVRKTDGVVVNVDYRLCPENRWPAPPEDCWAAVKWALAHAGEYGGDCGKIVLAGDSAGGNLAAVCALRARDEGLSAVKAQLLLYPVTNMGNSENGYYHGVDISKYMRSPRQAKVLEASLQSMLPMLEGGALNRVYLQGRISPDDPKVSPAMADSRGLPPTLLLFGEHDFLVFDNMAYARKLMAEGVECALVVYRGLGHGFADQIGVMPQAADCVCRMADFIKENV